MIYNNPIWDLGLQNQIRNINARKIYVVTRENGYSKKCICPCSSVFHKWHLKQGIDQYQGFRSCNATIYHDTKSFLQHLHYNQADFYHQIVLRIVQSYYSSILAKIKIFKSLKNDTVLMKSIRRSCLGIITLPKNIQTNATYESFTVERNKIRINLTKTNILINSGKSFVESFSEDSFQQTLLTLIDCGQYNKTQKRTIPMYCYGSTITCTRYPKFSIDGVQKILPRPYFKSKPSQKGYEILRTSMMQSFLQEVEKHVIHYLYNICEDQKLAKITLFQLELARHILPECLRLGNTFFSHMSVFGTLNKKDGEMPIHFDERDIISCIFHLGKVTRGGNTIYFDGDKPDDPGQNVYSVPFIHGTLQIGFFNKVLHGVQDWDGQRCGIQMNLKKDVLSHFVTYGTVHYDKYRLTGYPQGPIVYY